MLRFQSGGSVLHHITLTVPCMHRAFAANLEQRRPGRPQQLLRSVFAVRQNLTAIGLALVVIHLVSIPVTNTSVNPARSTGPALFVGGWALGQLWLFWIAPLLGGALGGVSYRWLSEEPTGTVEGRNP